MTDATPTPRVRRGAAARAGALSIDQIVTSIASILVAIFAAHTLSPANFGRFSVMVLVNMTLLAVARALVAGPIVLHPEDAETRPRAVLGSGSVVAVALAVPVFAIGGAFVWAGSAYGGPLLVLAAAWPLLQVHDIGRHLGIAEGTPRRALVLDLAWVVATVSLLAFFHMWWEISLTTVTLGWVGGAVLASLLVIPRYGLPRINEFNLGWVRERWGISSRMLVSSLSSNVGVLLAVTLITLVSSNLAVAAIRGAMLLIRPVGLLRDAIGMSTYADIARDAPDNRGLMAHRRRVARLLGGISLVNALVLVFLPDWLGRLILGNVWPVVEPLMLATAVAALTVVFAGGSRAALVGRRQMHLVMIIDLVSLVAVVVCLVGGAALGDGTGAMWGLCLSNAVTSFIWWLAFLRYVKSNPDE